MKFLVDAQLPPTLAAWLRSQGHEANHVLDVGLRDAKDAAIRLFAAQSGTVVVTKDRDFVPAASAVSKPIQVLWIRTGNVPNVEMFARLEASWPKLFNHLASGALLVELR